MILVKERTKDEDTSSNILLSLDYLKREAERDGDVDLCIILEIAHQLASDTSISYKKLLTRISHPDDLLKASLFVVEFLSASKEVQHNLMCTMDKTTSKFH